MLRRRDLRCSFNPVYDTSSTLQYISRKDTILGKSWKMCLLANSEPTSWPTSHHLYRKCLEAWVRGSHVPQYSPTRMVDENGARQCFHPRSRPGFSREGSE